MGVLRISSYRERMYNYCPMWWNSNHISFLCCGFFFGIMYIIFCPLIRLHQIECSTSLNVACSYTISPIYSESCILLHEFHRMDLQDQITAWSITTNCVYEQKAIYHHILLRSFHRRNEHNVQLHSYSQAILNCSSLDYVLSVNTNRTRL